MMKKEDATRQGAAFPEGTGRDGKSGFSLVEVTLALLVVAVGMTAAFALFPEAIKCTRAAQDNTEAALFADYVFSTLEVTAGYQAMDPNYTDVETKYLPSDADDFRTESLTDEDSEIRAGGDRAERFCWIPSNYGINGAEEMSRENLQGKLKTATFTYQLELEKKKAGGLPGGTPIVAVLKVWPGEYADGISVKDLEKAKAPLLFYREILPPK